MKEYFQNKSIQAVDNVFVFLFDKYYVFLYNENMSF